MGTSKDGERENARLGIQKSSFLGKFRPAPLNEPWGHAEALEGLHEMADTASGASPGQH